MWGWGLGVGGPGSFPPPVDIAISCAFLSSSGDTVRSASPACPPPTSQSLTLDFSSKLARSFRRCSTCARLLPTSVRVAIF